MRDSRLDVDLLPYDRVWMSRIAHPNSIDDQSWVALFRGVVNSRIHVTIEAVGIAETEPVEIVLHNTRHEQLDDVGSIGDFYLWWAVSGSNDTAECSWYQRICRKGVTNDCLDQGIDGTRVAVIEASTWDREDLAIGSRGQWYPKGSAIGVCSTKLNVH